MNLNLNFLPKKNRKEIVKISHLGWTLNLLRSAIVVLIIFDAFLILIWQAVNEQSQVLAKQTGNSANNSAFYGGQIIEINKKIDAVSKAGESFGALTPKFHELMTQLPTDIKLKNLSMGTDEPVSLALSGTAKTRDALIAYAESLKSISWVENVRLPKSLLLQKDNIDFNLELTLKASSDK